MDKREIKGRLLSIYMGNTASLALISSEDLYNAFAELVHDEYVLYNSTGFEMNAGKVIEAVLKYG
jgi:hypothetical protein